MSHSQFHSIDVFILRHAWLNLWDKRMLLAESTRLLSLELSTRIKRPESRFTGFYLSLRESHFLMTFHHWNGKSHLSIHKSWSIDVTYPAKPFYTLNTIGDSCFNWIGYNSLILTLLWSFRPTTNISSYRNKRRIVRSMTHNIFSEQYWSFHGIKDPAKD